MLYLIGLGLNEKQISKQALDIISRCKKVYLENYTVEFPYNQIQLEEQINKKVIIADREKVEGLTIVDESKKLNVALLVYGSPLMATTHISLIQEAKEIGIKYEVIQGPSIFDAVAETGLQIYKFGKTASIPCWQKNFEPTSFVEIIKQNQSIDAHTLILADIGLEFPDALKQIEKVAEKNDLKLKKIVVCQTLGTKNQKIHYKNIEELKKFTGVKKPYCIIIPSQKLHQMEIETLESHF